LTEQTGVVLTAVVSTYKRRALLADCLESLAKALAAVPEPSELIVVDNGSEEGTSELVRARSPGARILTLGTNRGYTGAVAAGIAAASGEWIALLNDDLTFEPAAFAELLRAGRAAPEIGSVTPQMRFASEPHLLNSAGIVVDRLGVVFDRLVGEPVEASETEDTDVFGASGGAGLFRRLMLDELGGMDDSFFMFLEDGDLAWRARMAGWRAVYAPRAVVYHHHSASAGHGSSLKHYLVGRNRIRILAKNAGRRQLLRYGAAIVVYDVCYVAFAAVVHRTLAPVRGRLRGLAEWRRYRRAGSPSRGPLALPPSPGLRGALRRHGAWTTSSSKLRDRR